MSPSTQPVRNIKVKVPRHNSQRIGPVVTAQVETLARESKVRVDVRQTAYEPSSALAQAIVSVERENLLLGVELNEFAPQESASEWNSLLLTARAEFCQLSLSSPIKSCQRGWDARLETLQGCFSQ